jgi:hypothetical protein
MKRMRIAMKRILAAVVVLFLSASVAFVTPTNLAASGGQNSDQKPNTQQWTVGWDKFTEPLNYDTSHVSWSVDSAKKTLRVRFGLRGATPNKLYQVGIHIYCNTPPTNFGVPPTPATFGQFPTNGGPGGTCQPGTRQGVTENVVSVEMGAVTTDLNGNGTFEISVGPIYSGPYNLEFDARDAAGCNLIGGADPDGTDCYVDFQSPGPFGTATTITIP